MMRAMSRVRVWLLVASALLATACGDDAAPSTTDDDAATNETTQDASAQDASTQDAGSAFYGTFSIELVEAVPATEQTNATPPFNVFAGLVHAREKISNMQWTRLDEAGDCELFAPLMPFCDPSCTSREICSPAGECVAVPSAVDLGPASVQGLVNEDGEAAAVTLTARAPSFNYFASGAGDLAYPPFQAPDTVSLRFMDGGELGPFELSAAAIAPLTLLTEAPLSFDPDAATVVRWTPAVSGSRSRIELRVDISHHGGNKGELLCNTEDDGELELPAALVQGLIDLGVAGFPSLTVTRESRSEPLDRAPGLTLKIFSSLLLPLEIPGIVSCTEVGEQDVCPDGQTCLVTRVCG